ncbi:MAG: DUF58 domain-containing protein [Chloroflexi bacterium]|nr:DUF58 domain-containing protein [Chloroflexota bacterium]
MTKTGFGFIFGGVFLYFLASQSQIGWLYLFDAIIWSALVLSVIIDWYSLSSLKVERQVLRARRPLHRSELSGPVEDDTVEVKLKVTNSGRLSRYFIKILEDCPFDQPGKPPRAFILNKIGPRSVTAFSYTAVCYQRGHYQSARTTLQASDPLGLFVRRRVWKLPLNLTVFPAYYPMKGLFAAETLWSDDRGVAAKSPSGFEFYGSREYQYGDPLKHIHWRNTARVGHFMLKEFEKSGQGPVTVAFATSPNPGTGRETTLEYSIKIAASLARFCADSGRSINMVAGEKGLRHAGWQDSMDFLARLETGGKGAWADLKSIVEPGEVVVAIVPKAAIELIPAVWQQSQRMPIVVVVLLEGFAPNEPDNEFTRQPSRSNLDVIVCSRGNLEAAIEKLGSSSFLTGRLALPEGKKGKIRNVRS